jgi:hypothetical protein
MNDFPKYPTVWAGMGVGPHVNKKDYDKLWFYAKEHIAALERDLSAARAECEMLRKDAGRYQWISDNIDEFNRIQKENIGVEIERAIDAAIAREGRE